MSFKLHIVSPSKGRWENLRTAKLFPETIFVVPPKELEQYREHNPGIEFVPQPDHVKGLVATRQWILEQYPNVFMIDDDVKEVRRMYAETGDPYIVEPEVALEVIHQNAHIAKQMGAFMFGFASSRNPLEYRAHQPFKLTGYMNASFCGFLEGHGLSYDLTMNEAEDHYISCMNMYEHRFCFIDTRFSFLTVDNFIGEGGIASARTSEDMMRNTIHLKKLFGNVINAKGATALKKNVHLGERSLSFPF